MIATTLERDNRHAIPADALQHHTCDRSSLWRRDAPHGNFPVTDKATYVAVVCFGIPQPVVAGACGLYVYDVYGSVANTFKTAAATGQCVELGFALAPPHTLISWKPYSC